MVPVIHGTGICAKHRVKSHLRGLSDSSNTCLFLLCIYFIYCWYKCLYWFGGKIAEKRESRFAVKLNAFVFHSLVSHLTNASHRSQQLSPFKVCGC